MFALYAQMYTIHTITRLLPKSNQIYPQNRTNQRPIPANGSGPTEFPAIRATDLHFSLSFDNMQLMIPFKAERRFLPAKERII